MTKKTYTIPLVFIALTACNEGEASGRKYQNKVSEMVCGDAAYTLTSTCKKSEDPYELNQCKPQTLVIDVAGAKRAATLPELPEHLRKRIQASGDRIKRLFVVEWACSNVGIGPIATLRYSIGGGSAEYSDAWTHYDKSGKLIEGNKKLTPAEVSVVERNFMDVPSIMPD